MSILELGLDYMRRINPTISNGTGSNLKSNSMLPQKKEFTNFGSSAIDINKLPPVLHSRFSEFLPPSGCKDLK
jgi:Tat protein secretion system quality control protein TatD with DNase activity